MAAVWSVDVSIPLINGCCLANGSGEVVLMELFSNISRSRPSFIVGKASSPLRLNGAHLEDIKHPLKLSRAEVSTASYLSPF
jgi:hypothetical protein